MAKDSKGNFYRDDKYDYAMEKRSDGKTNFGNTWLLSKISAPNGIVSLRPNSPLISMYGCRTCSWKRDGRCPHLEDESFQRLGRHSRGYCSEKILVVKAMQEEFKKGNYSSTTQIDQLMRTTDEINSWKHKLAQIEEEEVFDSDGEKAKSKKIDSVLDRLERAEHRLTDQLSKFRKQEEGSKVTVENVLDKMRGVIDVKAEEVDTIEVDDV